MLPETLATIRAGNARKGDIVATARIAGIMAAKRTHELIPLCHPLAISGITVDITPDDALPGLRVTATVRVAGQTGVAGSTWIGDYSVMGARTAAVRAGERRPSEFSSCSSEWPFRSSMTR